MFQLLMDRNQQVSGRFHVPTTGLSSDPHAGTRINALLAVQRKMIQIPCRIRNYAAKLRRRQEKSWSYKSLQRGRFGIVCRHKSERQTSFCLFGGTLAKKNIASLDRRSFEFDPGVVCNVSERGGILARELSEQDLVRDWIQSMASPEPHRDVGAHA